MTDRSENTRSWTALALILTIAMSLIAWGCWEDIGTYIDDYRDKQEIMKNERGAK